MFFLLKFVPYSKEGRKGSPAAPPGHVYKPVSLLSSSPGSTKASKYSSPYVHNNQFWKSVFPILVFIIWRYCRALVLKTSSSSSKLNVHLTSAASVQPPEQTEESAPLNSLLASLSLQSPKKKTVVVKKRPLTVPKEFSFLTRVKGTNRINKTNSNTSAASNADKSAMKAKVILASYLFLFIWSTKKLML